MRNDFIVRCRFFIKSISKKIFFVDTLTWIGIKLISTFHFNPKVKRSAVRNYILVSDVTNKALQLALKKDVELISNNYSFQDNQEIIFDASKTSFKEIINKMENLSNHNKLTYKILPKKTNFIIGSNSSKLKGEVITF